MGTVLQHRLLCKGATTKMDPLEEIPGWEPHAEAMAMAGGTREESDIRHMHMLPCYKAGNKSVPVPTQGTGIQQLTYSIYTAPRHDPIPLKQLLRG